MVRIEGSRICRTVLVVDDDTLLRNALARGLRGRGFEVATASSYDQALAVAQRAQPDMAILDLRIGDHSGVEVLRALRQIVPSVQAVLMSGYGSIATAVEAMRAGAMNFLPKPATVDEILAALRDELPAMGSGGAGSAMAAHVGPAWQAPSVARTEWEHITRVVSECRGNISEAARRMGMHRRSLQRKLAKQPPSR
jgi:two-component system, response regulator RegA